MARLCPGVVYAWVVYESAKLVFGSMPACDTPGSEGGDSDEGRTVVIGEYQNEAGLAKRADREVVRVDSQDRVTSCVLG